MPQEYELLEDFYEAEHRGRRLADQEVFIYILLLFVPFFVIHPFVF
jgi:hypothetical protein